MIELPHGDHFHALPLKPDGYFKHDPRDIQVMLKWARDTREMLADPVIDSFETAQLVAADRRCLDVSELLLTRPAPPAFVRQAILRSIVHVLDAQALVIGHVQSALGVSCGLCVLETRQAAPVRHVFDGREWKPATAGALADVWGPLQNDFERSMARMLGPALATGWDEGDPLDNAAPDVAELAQRVLREGTIFGADPRGES